MKKKTSTVTSIAGRSEQFGIGVGVHQGSAPSPLLFICVMEEATKECRVEKLMELFYADNLKEKVRAKFLRSKDDMERRGQKDK